MTRPVSTITSPRHPAAIGAFTAAGLVGVWALLVPGGQSAAVGAVLPGWFTTMYYAGLGLSGLAGVAALALPAQDVRLRAERCCWYGVGWSALFYSLAAWTVVGPSAGHAAISVGALSPVATWRIVQITRERRRAARDRALNLPADPAPIGSPSDTGTEGGART